MEYAGIEGIISSGKTTLAMELSKRLGWLAIEEPVKDNFVFPHFAKDQKRYAFAMQMLMLHKRDELQQFAVRYRVPCILDRTYVGDGVFARMHHELGNISDVEWQVYRYCFDNFTLLRPPFVLLYLEVDAEEALQRMRERGRAEEQGLTLDYLRSLKLGYERMLEEVASGTHAWSRGMEVIRWRWEHGDHESEKELDRLAGMLDKARELTRRQRA